MTTFAAQTQQVFGQSSQGARSFGQVAPDAGAPYWLKDGIRLTYYSSSASIPATSHYYTPDDKGDWVDDKGNRYYRGDNPSPAGHGLTQLNIACVDGDVVVVQSRSYGTYNGVMVPLGTIGYATPAGSCDWWTDPKTLQQTQDATSGDTKIWRLPWTANGKTYKAIAFRRDTRDSHSWMIYDTVTGLLLNSNVSSVSADGRQYLGQSKFIDWRTLHWPWEKTNAPGWLASTSSLNYQGTYRMIIPGSPDLPQGMSILVNFTRKTRKWASYSIQSTTEASYGMTPIPSTVELVSGPSIFGGIWIDPAALRRLTQGQVLDQDKLAGTTVAVTQAGGPSVQLTETGPLHSDTYSYDANTGILVQAIQANQMVHSQTEVKLTR